MLNKAILTAGLRQSRSLKNNAVGRERHAVYNRGAAGV